MNILDYELTLLLVRDGLRIQLAKTICVSTSIEAISNMLRSTAHNDSISNKVPVHNIYQILNIVINEHSKLHVHHLIFHIVLYRSNTS